MGVEDPSWQVAIAAIAGGVALWQFWGTREHRRAGELLQLEQALASATRRKDLPVSHAIRAQLYRRLAAHHGNHAASGVWAVFWTLVMFSLLAFGSAVRGNAVAAYVVIFGFASSFWLAGRYYSRWVNLRRNHHNEAGVMLEAAIIAERQAFVASHTNTAIPKSYEEAQKQVQKDIAKGLKQTKDYVLWIAGTLVASIAWAALLQGPTAEVGLDVVRLVTFLLAGAALGGIPLASLAWRRRVTKGAWIVAWTSAATFVVMVPLTMRDVWAWLQEDSPQPVHFELFSLGLFLAVSLGCLFLTLNDARIRRKKASDQAESNGSPQ